MGWITGRCSCIVIANGASINVDIESEVGNDGDIECIGPSTTPNTLTRQVTNDFGVNFTPEMNLSVSLVLMCMLFIYLAILILLDLLVSCMTKPLRRRQLV